MKSILRFITRRLSVWPEDEDGTTLKQLKQVQREKDEKQDQRATNLNFF